MTERPKIKLELTTTDKALEFAGWVAVFVMWGLTIANYSSLPDTIPTHYGLTGKADAFGGKAIILALPFIATILFAGLTLSNKIPHRFNYPIMITNENALKQYTLATRMMRHLKLIIVVLFGYITFQTIQTANGQADGLGNWLLPVGLVVVFIPLTFYFVEARRGTQGK